jgi:hypothetical protein
VGCLRGTLTFSSKKYEELFNLISKIGGNAKRKAGKRGKRIKEGKEKRKSRRSKSGKMKKVEGIKGSCEERNIGQQVNFIFFIYYAIGASILCNIYDIYI